jgi:antitoxin component YwqK of YwqJK toxin-antitoxin module
LELDAIYKNNLRHGKWKFYENGEFQYLLEYNNGKILNPEVLDSIANVKMQNIEKNKGTITDPEKFIEDPSEYMRKMKIY